MQERPIVWQAQQRRRMAVNKAAANALRLQKQLEARCAAAAAEGSPLPLPELLLEPSWRAALAPELASPGFRSLDAFLQAEWAAQRIFPAKAAIFRALNACPLPAVRAVILGQDPYHDDGQAVGLSFSVPRGVAPPSSLQNIFKASSSAALALAGSGVGSLIPVPAPAARVPSGRGASRAQRAPARLRLRSAPGATRLSAGAGNGPRPGPAAARRPIQVGEPGRAAAQHRADGARAQRQQPQGQRLGSGHGRRHPGGVSPRAAAPGGLLRSSAQSQPLRAHLCAAARCRGGLREVLFSCCGVSRRRTRSV